VATFKKGRSNSTGKNPGKWDVATELDPCLLMAFDDRQSADREMDKWWGQLG